MANMPDHRVADTTARVVSHPAITRQPPARLLQRIWGRWQSFANDRLRQLLLDLDDDLFARADAAENSVMQEMYFNAMRLLRYQTDAIRTRFAAEITASVSKPAPNARKPAEGDDATSLESRLEELTLIEEDVLEQRLAVSTMTQRFERAHTLEVLLAQRRIEALRAQLDPDSSAARITLDARVLAEAFATSLSPMDLDLRIRLILFKHFENEVMEPLAGLFREFNALLVEAGVLPKLDLTAEVRRKQAGATQNKPAVATPEATSPAAQEQAQTHPESTATAPSAQAGPLSSSGKPLLPPGYDLEDAINRRSALMRKLPALRHQRRFNRSSDSSQLLDVRTVLELLEASERLALRSWRDSDLDRLPQRLDLAALLLEEAGRKGQSQAALRGADEDTVNLLQMLFDLILNDDHLAIPMRALVARLQLPMLRVALVDPAFFSSSRHPARRFLNAISRAGIGWSQAEEKSRDRLYAGIEHLVQRAGTEFAGDTTLFDELREGLDRLLRAEAERIRAAEARVIAQEQARIAAERTRRIVTRLIQHRLACAPPLPPALKQFLQTDWQQVLMRAHGDPEVWQCAFAVLRRLTGSGTGPDGSDLHGALANGLGLLALSPTAASATAAEVLAMWVEAESDGALATPSEGDTHEDPNAELAELTAAATEESSGGADQNLPSPAALAAAQALVEQTWVELHTRADKLVRCRLASITENPERCIFLNRRGLRIETLSRLEIAQALEAERLRILDDRQLFDRALEQVIGGLRAAPATTA
ncbi:MAG: DUF1631 family protein [Gammaproteobacteria bacterium]|nr:DUF1631 family protein [Gammaproteobacteria bacterium]